MDNAQLFEALKQEFGGVSQTVVALQNEVTALKSQLGEKDTAIRELAERVSRGESVKHDAVVRTADGRVVRKVSDGLATFALKAMKRELSTATGPDGGYLVNPEYVPELLEIVTSYGQFRPNVRVVPMTTDEKIYPALDGGVTLSWHDGNLRTDIPKSDPTFGQVKLNVKTLAGRTDIPHGLIADADPALGSIIVDVFGRAFGKEEDRVGFTAKVASGDPFDGILHAAGVKEVAMATGAGSADGSALKAEELLDLTDAIETGAKGGARFYMHPTWLSKVKKLRENNDGTGAFIWQGPSQGEPATIWGYPYTLIESMPSVSQVKAANVAGTPFIIFGNLIYVMLGDRQQVQFDASKDEKFSSIVTVFRFFERLAIKVAQPTGLARLKTGANA